MTSHNINAEQIKSFTLTNNNGMTVTAINLGCRITSVVAPDKNGELGNVVLGYANDAEYLTDDLYLGAICGRFSNRIAEGKLVINNELYQLETNNGPNALHGGLIGFNSVLWNVRREQTVEASSLVFTYLSADGENNYPGNMLVTVIYTLTQDNNLNIYYKAISDKDTVINLTQHTYFDLSAGATENALHHKLHINADAYVPTDATAIPLPEAPVPVSGTPFDFIKTKVIDEQFDWSNRQIEMALGFDHTYVLNKNCTGELSHATTLTDPLSGRVMEVHTTEPGLQFYTGNYITEGLSGADNRIYTKRSGVCLETQHFPNSPNRPDFPTTELKAGDTFVSETQFRFSVL